MTSNYPNSAVVRCHPSYAQVTEQAETRFHERRIWSLIVVIICFIFDITMLWRWYDIFQIFGIVLVLQVLPLVQLVTGFVVTPYRSRYDGIVAEIRGGATTIGVDPERIFLMEWGKVRELTFEHCHKLAGQIVELEKEMKRLKELPIIGKIAGDRHTELRKMMVDHSQLLSSLGWSGKYQDYLRNYQEYFG